MIRPVTLLLLHQEFSVNYMSLITVQQPKKPKVIQVAGMEKVEIYYIDGDTHQIIWKMARKQSVCFIARHGFPKVTPVKEISCFSITILKGPLEHPKL